MLTYIPGATATVVVGTKTQTFSSLALNKGEELLPVLVFGQGYREGIAGIKDFSGEIGGPIASNDTNNTPLSLPGTTATLTITFATGCSVSCSVVFGTARIGVTPEGLPGVSYPFVKSAGSSDPTINWS